MTPLLLLVQNRPTIAIIVFIGLILVVRALVLRVLRKKALIYYAFLFPGVVLHEISHILGCIIVGAQIKKASLFNAQGGYVMHEEPALPVIGNLVISIFPLIVGICATLILTKYFLGNISDLQFTFSELGKAFFALYIGVSIIINMLPSWQDFINASYGYIFFFCIVIILEARFPVVKEQLFSLALLMGTALIVLGAFLVISYIANFVHEKF